MNKKIRLLALAAVSAAVLALPTTASALESLHLNPTPVGARTLDGIGQAIFSDDLGNTYGCKSVAGSATLNPGGTTGTLSLAFGQCTISWTCTTPGQNLGNIVTTVLPFDLVTLPGGKPGILVTSNSGHFMSYKCGPFGVYSFQLTGGLIGTISSECDITSNNATISFTQATAGVQAHTKVSGTEDIYGLSSSPRTIALNMHLTLTYGTNTQLVCT